jgi:hypothetical protein
VKVLKSIVIKLDGKCAEIQYIDDLVRLIGEDFSFEFTQRSIVLSNVSSVEMYLIRGGRKRAIYAKYSGRYPPCSIRGEVIREEASTPLFTVRVTKCGVDSYLTIIFSGLFLIDYAIISRDTIGLVVPGKRDVYIERTGDSLAIYIV